MYLIYWYGAKLPSFRFNTELQALKFLKHRKNIKQGYFIKDEKINRTKQKTNYQRV